MTSSLIKSGAAALVAALAFAACAGNSTVPSSNGLPMTSEAIHSNAPDGTAPPCPLPVGWVFGGPCDAVPLSTTGGKGSLKAYQGFTLTSVLASGAPKGTVLLFQDATGKGDITGKVNKKAFPLLKGSILYLAAVNTGKPFSFNATPQITIKSKAAIPGKECTLNQLAPKGKGFTWNATPIHAAPKGKSVNFGSFGVPEAIPSGAFFLAFSCQ
jgi:hypothetical protein